MTWKLPLLDTFKSNLPTLPQSQPKPATASDIVKAIRKGASK